MSGFGELVLVLGDLHVPDRASKIPAAFQRMLVPNKMQHCICTGNLSTEDHDMLRGLVPNLHVVAGDYDNNNDSSGLIFPETRVVQVGNFRIGVVHGHQILPWNSPQALARWKRQLGGVDILITGHTHRNEVAVAEDGASYHINPGSITGAYSPLAGTATDAVVPSFVLLAVQDNRVVCYVYELTEDGEVDVSKTEFTKRPPAQQAQEQPAANPALLQSLLS